MMMTEGDYCIRYLDQPNYKIRGSVHIDEDGFANIYINPRLSTEQQLKSMLHELAHLENDDLYNDDPLSLAEARASRKEAPPPDPFKRVYDRGMAYYGLRRDDPLWNILFDLWHFRHHKDRFVGLFTRHSKPSRKQAAEMVEKIFDT